jgi:hypothetical protein
MRTKFINIYFIILITYLPNLFSLNCTEEEKLIATSVSNIDDDQKKEEFRKLVEKEVKENYSFSESLKSFNEHCESYNELILNLESGYSYFSPAKEKEEWLLKQLKVEKEWIEKINIELKDSDFRKILNLIADQEIKKLDKIKPLIDKVEKYRINYLEDLAVNIKNLKVGEDTKDSVQTKIPPPRMIDSNKRCQGNSWTYSIITKEQSVVVAFTFDSLAKLKTISVTKSGEGGSGTIYQKGM